jgi:hypothetical protein
VILKCTNFGNSITIYSCIRERGDTVIIPALSPISDTYSESSLITFQALQTLRLQVNISTAIFLKLTIGMATQKWYTRHSKLL